MGHGKRLPETWEAGALYEGLSGASDAEGDVSHRQLALLASREGYLHRLLIDAARGLTAIEPHAVTPVLMEFARVDPATVIDLLEGGDRTGSLVAAHALGRLSPEFDAAVFAAASSPKPHLRLAATAALAEAAQRASLEAVETLGRMLGDPDPQVRWSAAVSLGSARGAGSGSAPPVQRAVELLREAAAGEDERAAPGAVFGLARIWEARKGEVRRLLMETAERESARKRCVAMAVWQSAAGTRGAAAQIARRFARDPDPEVRAVAVRELARWASDDQAAERELARLAGDPEPLVRASAGEALARLGVGRAKELVALASDPSALVRAAVAEGLRALTYGHRAVLEALAQDRAASVRAAAVRSLATRGDREAARVACRDPDPLVRAAGAFALANGDPGDRDLLLSLTGDQDVAVVRAAARALGRLLPAPSGPGWDRLVALAAGGTAAEAAADGLAAALDRSPESAPEILLRWRAGAATGTVLARVARSSRDWRVAELARTLRRALEQDGSAVEALSDVQIALQAAGAGRAARLLGWLGLCAGCTSCQEVARTASASQGGSRESAAHLALAGKAIGKVAAGDGQALVSAEAALEAVLEPEPEPERQTLEWLLARRVARRWREMLSQVTPTPSGSDLRVTVPADSVVCYPGGTLVVELENRGAAVLTGIEVGCGPKGMAAGPPALPPGAVREVQVPHAAAQDGLALVQGEVAYHCGAERHVGRFEGTVRAVKAAPLPPVANPYVVGKPLVENSAMFFGRAAEMEWVERTLTAGQSGPVVALVGQRRTGKTSLLRQLAGRLTERYRPVFVDVQGMLVSNTDSFFEQLASPAWSAPDDAAMLSDGPMLAATGPEMVREIASRSGRPVVILMDEFDDLTEKVRSGHIGAEVFTQLRNIIQHTDNLGLVLSGTHRLEELGGEHWSFLLNLATYRRVGCFERPDAERVLREPLARLGIVCEEAAVRRALRLTGGHPYFLQLTGYRLVESCVEAGKGAVRVGLVEEVADQVVDQGDIHLRYLWESAGEAGRPIIRALAEAEHGLSAEEIGSRVDLSPDDVQACLARLVSFELVAGDGSRYVLRMGLLSRWLRRMWALERGALT